MSKKKRRAPKGDVVWRQSAEEATLAKKPHYNGFACGHGAHGSAKYDRTKSKRAWEKRMRQEGASRGSFLYVCCELTRAVFLEAVSTNLAATKKDPQARELRRRKVHACTI